MPPQFPKIVILAVCLASVSLADDFKAISGKEYKNVTVTRVEPDGLVLRTKSGISKVYFTELPQEVQERFHYNAQQATQSTSQADFFQSAHSGRQRVTKNPSGRKSFLV